jgi:phosphoglycolate phosphatase
MNVFFDLDGTLLDAKPRMFNLFQGLISESNFSFDDYWLLKQNRISHAEILVKYFEYDEKKLLKFNKEWMSLIETSDWLSYDQLIPGVIPFLNRVKESHKLYIVTARQSETIANQQIHDLGIAHFFKGIFVTGQKHEKFAMIQNNVHFNKQDWMVGDTGKDIETGKILGINTAAVLSGFMNKNSLLNYFPDVLLNSVVELKI